MYDILRGLCIVGTIVSVIIVIEGILWLIR